jgi:hypothetical protein
VKEEEQRKAQAQVSMPTRTKQAMTLTTTTSSVTAPFKESASLSEDQDLAEACKEIEDMEILSARK